MRLDKKLIHRIFLCLAGLLILVWLLTDTQRVQAVWGTLSSLLSPFVMGAAVAFVFNVPMRAIERQLEGIRKPELRRILAILLTLAALILVLAFVVELLIPQIQATIESLAETIPQFVKRQAASVTLWLEEHPELREWVMANTDLEKIDWASLLQKAGSVVAVIASAMTASVTPQLWE